VRDDGDESEQEKLGGEERREQVRDMDADSKGRGNSLYRQ